MNEITKQYPGVIALDHVSISACYGEVHALMGENGAGKSTLMKVLSGAHRADSGEIWFDGERVVMRLYRNQRQVRPELLRCLRRMT